MIFSIQQKKSLENLHNYNFHTPIVDYTLSKDKLQISTYLNLTKKICIKPNGAILFSIR